jgi:hypothetical protein
MFGEFIPKEYLWNIIGKVMKFLSIKEMWNIINVKLFLFHCVLRLRLLCYTKDLCGFLMCGTLLILIMLGIDLVPHGWNFLKNLSIYFFWRYQMKFQQFFYNVTCITFQVHNVLHSSCKGPLTLHTCNGHEFIS